jgi:hypothetical protein
MQVADIALIGEANACCGEGPEIDMSQIVGGDHLLITVGDSPLMLLEPQAPRYPNRAIMGALSPATLNAIPALPNLDALAFPGLGAVMGFVAQHPAMSDWTKAMCLYVRPTKV